MSIYEYDEEKNTKCFKGAVLEYGARKRGKSERNSRGMAQGRDEENLKRQYV